MSELKPVRQYPQFVADAARRLYEELDDKEIIGRLADHQMFQNQIEAIISSHFHAFLLENWPNVVVILADTH